MNGFGINRTLKLLLVFVKDLRSPRQLSVSRLAVKESIDIDFCHDPYAITPLNVPSANGLALR